MTASVLPRTATTGAPASGSVWRRITVLGLIGTLACLGLALLGHTTFPNPFSRAGQTIPLVLGAAVCLTTIVLARRAPHGGADLAAVLVAGWVSHFGASQLHGTPFPYGGMSADIARLTALATRFSAQASTADHFVKGLPAEYPPGFPWLVGRTAALTGLPAWTLMGVLSAVFCGMAVLFGYLLWRQLVGPMMALAVCLVPAAVYGDPRKAHEVMALCVITPWALGALGRLGRSTPRFHWAVGGVVGGLLVTVYQGYLTFGLLGLVVMVALGLRAAPRWPYLRHLLLTGVTAFATAAWFLGPWLTRLLRTGGDTSADTFEPFEAVTDPWHLPWQHEWPVAVWLMAGLLMLVGLARRHDWARHLLALALGAMIYRWVMFGRYQLTGHTAFFHYTDRLYDGILAIGAVLGATALRPRLAPVLALRSRQLAVAPGVAVAVVVAVGMGFYWDAHRAGHPDDVHTPNFTRLAHATELPVGGFPRFNAHAGQIRRFPAPEVRQIVERHLGANALPTTLTYRESLSSYYPYYQYIGVGGNSANSLAFWPRREAEVRRLASITDPAAFAALSGSMEHGQIDVFVLTPRQGKLMWRDVNFEWGQFDATYFRRERAADGVWVFVRIGAKVEHRDFPG